MKKQIDILIADNNTAFCLELQSILRNSGPLNFIGIAATTDEVLALAKLHKPDVLLYDLSLPGEEALSVLRKLRIQGTVREILVTTDFLSGYVSRSLASLGVAYCLLKPCPAALVATRLKGICRTFCHQPATTTVGITQSPPLIVQASELLLAVGIHTNAKGYQYLLYALTVVAENPDMAVGITKILYPQIAREFHTKTECVERNIRSAIANAYKTHAGEVWKRYFGGSIAENCCPSNGKFISALAQHMSIRNMKKHG